MQYDQFNASEWTKNIFITKLLDVVFHSKQSHTVVEFAII